MPSLASMLEDYRNWKGRQEWESGKGWQDFYGGDPDMQERMERFQGFGTGSHGLSGLSGLAGAIKASHGTPHAFDKFDMSKIGTGEGAQAYGHGLYYAQGFDSPVAKQYRDALSSGELRLKGGGEYDPSNPSHMAAAELMGYGGDKAKAISDIQQSIKELGKIKADWRDKAIQEKQSVIDLISKGNLPELEDFSHGHLYNVSLEWPNAAREAADPLGEHHLLDWDKPLSEQSPSVLDALKNAGVDILPEPKSSMIKDLGVRQIVRSALKQDAPENVGLMVDNDYQLYQQAMNLAKKMGIDIDESSPGDFITQQAQDYLRALHGYQGQTGESSYRSLMGSPTSMVESTKKLKNVGIPGIKYLDQGSRGAGQGTSNYVIFDQDIPKIISRNGVSLTDLLRR